MRTPSSVRNKRTYIILILLAVALVSASVLASVVLLVRNYVHTNVFSLSIDDTAVCFVRTRQDADEAVELFDKKAKSSGIESVKKISAELKSVRKPQIADPYDAAELLFNEAFAGYIRCYAVKIDGQSVAYCLSYDDADTAINELKEHTYNYIVDGAGESGDIAFSNVFSIESTMENRSHVMTLSEIRENVIGVASSETNSYYIIDDTAVRSHNSSDNALNSLSVEFGVSRSYNTSENALHDISFGNTNVAVDYYHVSTVTYTEILRYETEYIESNKLYVGETSVRTPGSYGTVVKTALIRYNSDGSTSREILQEEVIVPTKSEVILKGIKKYPSTKPTGSFIWPLESFTVTSNYGEYRSAFDRSKSGHLGMDLAAPSGTPVRAADGGVVIFAAEYSSYGNLIKIQHEDGVVSYYAHLSEILVNEGDNIYKGQTIAEVGMTGQATGPHLHFEVRINNQTVDPLKYLP